MQVIEQRLSLVSSLQSLRRWRVEASAQTKNITNPESKPRINPFEEPSELAQARSEACHTQLVEAAKSLSSRRDVDPIEIVAAEVC